MRSTKSTIIRVQKPSTSAMGASPVTPAMPVSRVSTVSGAISISTNTLTTGPIRETPPNTAAVTG